MIKLVPLFFSAFSLILSGKDVYNWESPPEEVMKTLKKSEVREISVNDIFIKTNRIIAHTVTVNPDIKTDLTAFTCGNSDYVFIKRRLICVCRTDYNLDAASAEAMASQIRSQYSSESLVNENGITTYNMYDDLTNVSLSVRAVGEKRDIRVYYYPKNIFGILMKL